MRPLKRRQNPDPSPSRWAYKAQRLMLTPSLRFMLRAGVPFLVMLALGTHFLSDPVRQDAINAKVAEMRNAIETRPEFMVNLMAIDGATDAVAQDIRTILPLDFPTSSFDLDLPAMRDVVAQLEVIKDVSIRIRPGGVLQIDVVERDPAVIWRTEDALVLLDVTGVEIAEELVRSSRPHLPLVAGMGADEAVPEALALYRAAGPLSPRLRGLVRMGERRWDVILDRDQRIMLPAEDPVPALERVIALSEAQDVLARDVALIDMRLAARPTLKMNPDALTQWWRITQPLRAEQTDD